MKDSAVIVAQKAPANDSPPAQRATIDRAGLLLLRKAASRMAINDDMVKLSVMKCVMIAARGRKCRLDVWTGDILGGPLMAALSACMRSADKDAAPRKVLATVTAIAPNKVGCAECAWEDAAGAGIWP